MEEKESPMKFSTGGVFDSVDRLAQAITALGGKHNLVIPGGAISKQFPLLHAVGLSFVFVDPEKETYPIQGRDERGMGKAALERIAAAAGVHWNPHLCGRVDDGSSPYVIEYQAAGTYMHLDGTESMIHASKRIDLRAERNASVETWGADAAEIARIAATKENRDPWPQILQQRQHILSLAESKAKNRAIRSLGVRTAYTPADLAKGFLVLRLQFTGRSDDPEVEREVSMMIARRALSSSSALYGGEDRHMAPAPLQAQKPVPRIVVQESKDEPEEDPGNGNQAPAAKLAEKPAEPPKDDPLVICGPQNQDKSWPKKKCSELSIDELHVKIEAYEKRRPKWDPKWAAKNEAELKALRDWLSFRELSIPKAAAAQPDEVPF